MDDSILTNNGWDRFLADINRTVDLIRTQASSSEPEIRLSSWEEEVGRLRVWKHDICSYDKSMSPDPSLKDQLERFPLLKPVALYHLDGIRYLFRDIEEELRNPESGRDIDDVLGIVEHDAEARVEEDKPQTPLQEILMYLDASIGNLNQLASIFAQRVDLAASSSGRGESNKQHEEQRLDSAAGEEGSSKSN